MELSCIVWNHFFSVGILSPTYKRTATPQKNLCFFVAELFLETKLALCLMQIPLCKICFWVLSIEREVLVIKHVISTKEGAPILLGIFGLIFCSERSSLGTGCGTRMFTLMLEIAFQKAVVVFSSSSTTSGVFTELRPLQENKR